MRDQEVRGEKLLLAYPYLITQLHRVMGVLEHIGIDEMIEAIRTANFGLIRDEANSFARQVADALVGMYPHSRPVGMTKATKAGA